MKQQLSPRSILSVSDLTGFELFEIIERATELKPQIKSHHTISTLYGQVIGLLFEKPSTRTRASFETATRRLLGEPVYLSSSELQTSRGERPEDTARILGSYFDAIVARVHSHKTLEDLARFGGVPIINALSDLEHPTQAISDLFTIFETKGRMRGLRLAFIGDGNNVCNSLLLSSALIGMNMTVACPEGYEPKAEVLDKATMLAKETGSSIEVVSEPKEATEGSDVIYTDVWVSMGEEDERNKRIKDFAAYRVDRELLSCAKPNALVMHCLPAHRGEEITEEVISGVNSVVWQQAENKLYGAGAVLEFLLARDILEEKIAPLL